MPDRFDRLGERFHRSGVAFRMSTPLPLRVLVVTLLAVATVSVSQPASGQVTAADSAAVLLGAAAELEQRGESDAAETLYRYIANRFEGTPAAVTARTWLDAASAERSQGGGETELKVWSTTYGIWLGVSVPLALNADGPEPYGVGLLLGAPGGFFGARALARSRPFSLGQARAVTWGGTWGALQGMALANAMDFGGGERIIEGDIVIDEEADEEAIIGTMVIGSAVGIAGGMLAARQEIRPGTATSATLGSLWGSWFGLATSILADLDSDPTWATLMLTGNAGLVGGALAGSRLPLSRSRARLISVGGLIGGVGGLGIVLIADVDDEDTAIGVTLAGSILGLALGGALTRGHDAEEDLSGAAEEGGGLPAAGALFNWSGGDWSLAAPLPSPLVDPGLRRRGRAGADGRDGLAWKIPLLKVRF